MNCIRTKIEDVCIIEPRVFGDARGFFYESFNSDAFAAATGVSATFVQDNHSRSARGVLRGLHYQIRQPQGKLVRATVGEIWDVAADIRKSSPTFGKWVGFTLSAQSRRIAWIPVGFAHGFLVLSDAAEMEYKATDYYAPEHERTISWNDPDLGIAWPLTGSPIVAKKDTTGKRLRVAEVYE